MTRRIEFPDCTVEHCGDYILTTWSDGTSTANWPPADEGGFAAIAAGCGFGPDRLLDYLYEHEVLHVLLPLRLFGARPYVSWMAAHCKPMSLAGAKAEERLIYWTQRAMADPMLPCVDVQIAALRDEMLALRAA